VSPDQEAPRRTATGVAFAFAAAAENVELFIAAVHGFLAENGLGHLAFDVELLAREALVNAVLHGCGGDPSKTVRASLVLERGRLVLDVVDEGAGWDWRSLPARDPEPSGESGRGLFIIRKYSDGFSYNDVGNSLRIVKALPTEEKAMTSEPDNQVRMTLEPRLSAKDAPALRELFRQRIQEGARRIVLDCGRMESIDSVGIGLLVATHNSLAKLGGALMLTEVRKDIYQLLTLMRLDKHFSIAQAKE
jgi:anti-anti-sigma factor